MLTIKTLSKKLSSLDILIFLYYNNSTLSYLICQKKLNNKFLRPKEVENMSRVPEEALKEKGIELPPGFYLEEEGDFLFLYFQEQEETIANFNSLTVDPQEVRKEAEEYLKRTGRAKETKGEEKKRPTAHKRAEVLLGENPLGHLYTLARMYQAGTVVPVKDIPGLIEAFRGAKAKMLSLVNMAIEALEKQMKETKEKED